MRYFRLACITLAMTLLAGMSYAKRPWGVRDDIPEETSFEIYAVDNLIDNRPIRYAVSQGVSPAEENTFRENILKWPAETLQFIRKSGRAQEFKDITPILERGLVLQRVPVSATPDIFFDIVETPPCNGSVACFIPPGENFYSAIVLATYKRSDLKTLSLHEIGHYFGLADQYDRNRHSSSHAEYSSDVNEKDSSVMDDKTELTCDDADGLINLIDLRRSQRTNGRFSARAQQGWRSLCRRSKNVYQNAKTINRQRYDAWEENTFDMDVIFMREYKNGNLQQQTLTFTDSPIHVFQVDGKDRVKRDPNTRLIQAVYTPRETFAANGPSSITWEKHFTYGKPTICDGKKCIPVSVREVVNGKQIRQGQIFISADGSLSGDVNALLTPNRYTATDMGTQINFKIENRRITFYALKNQENHIDVRGFPGQAELFRFRGEQREICSLPLKGACEELIRYYKLYDSHREHLISFYKNFYEPLFGARQQQEQVRRQVQDTLRSRR